MKTFDIQDDFEQVVSLMASGVEVQMSPKLKDKYEKLKYAARLLKKWGSLTKVVEVLRGIYPEMSERSAYDIAYKAPRYFAILNPLSDRAFYIGLLLENTLETRRMLKASRDEKAMLAGLTKNDDTLMKLIKDILPNQNAINLEDLQEPDLVIEFRPQDFPLAPQTQEELDLVLKELSEVPESKKYTDFEEIEDE